MLSERGKKGQGRASAEATAQNYNRQKQHYHNKPLLSRINRTQRHQHHGWFTELLILTSKQIRGKGNLRLANYYAQLAANSTANPRGGLVR